MATREQKIQAGMALLDKRMPGWEREIDLDRLDLGIARYEPGWGSCGCVLAQLDLARKHRDGITRARVGNYNTLCSRWGLTPEEELELGFNQNRWRGSWANWTAAWVRAIKSRLGGS